MVEKIESEKKEGDFTVVEVQDNFIYKGRVVQLGHDVSATALLHDGDIVFFPKYSPDIHEVEHEGKKYKIIKVDDILAIE